MQRYCSLTVNTTWCRLRHFVQRSRSTCVETTTYFRQTVTVGRTPCRCLSGVTGHELQTTNMSRRQQDTIMNVFNRKAKRIQRDRAAVAEDHKVFDYLKDEFGYRLADRICDIKRKFDVAVELGCGKGLASRHIYSDMVTTLYQCELSGKLLELCEPSPEVTTYKVVADEEFFPFRSNSLDLVFTNLSLHWVNDLPGCFRQVQEALKSDAVFLGSMFGGDTLYQLRVALQLAELEREGGFGPHISPFTDVRDLGNLLNLAGFTMLTIDIDEMTVNYPTMYELMFDLKGMGENNCAWNRKSQLHRETMMAAAAIYQGMYGNDKGVPATFQVINFIGWKPDPKQLKAAKRGSGKFSLKDLDKISQLAEQIEIAQDRQGKDDSTSPK